MFLLLFSTALAAAAAPRECTLARMTVDFAQFAPSSSLTQSDWSLYVTVAACQEDLQWLRCDWHPNLRRIRVVHKCTKDDPGVRRCGSRIARQPLCEQEWKNATSWPDAPCIEHVSSAHGHRGRESEAYLSEIVQSYDRIRENDLHLFLQGGMDEIGYEGGWGGRFEEPGAVFQASIKALLAKVGPQRG